MQTEEFRDFSQPEKPTRQRHRRRMIPRGATYCVFASAALWLIGVYVIHLHPSRTTFAGALILLMLYSAESLDWHLPHRRREPKHVQWRDR